MANPNTETMKAIMRHPESSRMFRDAIKSPLGSTSRARAKKHFSIMNKLQTSHDGMGGPGMMSEQMSYGQSPAPEMDPIHIPTDNSKGMVIFNKIPTPKITYGTRASKDKPRAGSFDGKGGPGDWLSGALNIFGTAASNPPSNISSTLSPNFSISSLGGVQSPTSFSSLGNFSLPTQPKTNPSSLISGGVNPSPVTSPSPFVGTSYPNLSSMSNPTTGTPQFGKTNISINPSGQVGPTAPVWNPVTGSFSSPGASSEPVVTHPAATATTTPATTPSATTPSLTDVSGSPSGTGQTKAQGGTSYSGDPVSAAIDAIVGIESGGDYSAKSKVIPTGMYAGHQSYGKYQVLDVNIPDWTKAATGTAMTKEQFLASPEAQDAVAKMQIGALWEKYGNIADVASSWFTGGPAATSTGKTDPTTGVTADQYIAAATSTFNGITGGISTPGSTTGAPGETPTESTTGTGYAGVADAVKKARGSTGFALDVMTDPNNPITGGMGMAEAQALNKRSIWKEFDIDTLKKDVADTKADALALPMEMTNYIRSQDQYLNQTDQMINEYIAANEGKSHSNEENQAIAAHLNYLYTLRGAQNQKYIDYIGSSVAMNKVDLQRQTDQLTLNLTAATEALSSANAITKDVYDTYTKSLTDMYDAVEKAPDTAQHYRYVESLILNATAQQASDAAKMIQQQSYLGVMRSGVLQDVIYDSKGFAKDIDLVSVLSDLARSNPETDPGTTAKIYTVMVNNVLTAATDSSNTPTDAGGTPISKGRTANQAFVNFAKLAGEGRKEGSNELVMKALGLGQEVAKTYGSILGGQMTNDVVKVKDLISSLGSKAGFFGGGTPSRSNFISNATAKGLSAEMAGAIYDDFTTHMATEGATAQGYVTSMLYDTSSQTNFSNETGQWAPLDDPQILNRVGTITATSLLSKALAQYAGLQLDPLTGQLTVLQSGTTTTI